MECLSANVGKLTWLSTFAFGIQNYDYVIGNNWINHEGFNKFLSLKSLTVLNSLDISNLREKKFGIGGEGSKFLAKALENYDYLAELNIAGNNISSNGAEFLAQSFKKMKTLTVLNIGIKK